MKKMNRRSFLASAATGAVAMSIPARSWAQVLGSADDVRVAVVGFGSRGQSHISGLSKLKGVRLAGLCDVDTTILGKEQQKWKDKGVDVKGYTDMRKLLESKEVDVISIATPNHWHALASIWAIQAGKDEIGRAT